MVAAKKISRSKTLSPQVIESIQDQVYELAEIIVSANYFVVDITMELENDRWYLRIYLDHPNQQVRVSLEDCRDISQALAPMIEESVAELKDFPYMLEISSPGLFRSLSRPREFVFYKGRRIEIKPKKQPAFIAYLQGYNPETQDLAYRLTQDEAEEIQLVAASTVKVSLCPDLTENIELKTVPRRINRDD